MASGKGVLSGKGGTGEASAKEQQIFRLVEELMKENEESKKFIPGQSKVHYSGPLFGHREVNAILSSLFDGWLAEGKNTVEFERRFSQFVGAKDAVVTNSGSSALLLSFAALMNRGVENPLKQGDEVITSALTFPTTLNAALLNGLSLAFVDVDRQSYNMGLAQLERTVTKKTRAILAMHHLGNPIEMDALMEIAERHDLAVVEDCCDAHGSSYKGKKLGSWGELGAFSFYGAHAMTMGEGGIITTSNEALVPLLLSLKTCGRACVCRVCTIAMNSETRCPIRFKAGMKGFEEYDKRTLYPNVGYKLKTLDLQAAMGLVQLERLPQFVKSRKRNFDFIVSSLRPFEKFLQLPEETKNSEACWFAVPLTIKEGAPFSRRDIVDFLEKKNIETRPLLGGNILKQPAYNGMKFRSTPLPNTDYFHDNSFYIGCHPGLTHEMLDYIACSFGEFFKRPK
ncbi:MAG: lipopolysaccharide biosynthesis protein RfbH [Candidatus Diapherotrites archaeon]